MLIKTFLLSIIVGVIGVNVPFNIEKVEHVDKPITQTIKQRNYQHTENVNGVEVIYKYETNEVNSIDDLVVGNIYCFNAPTNVFDTTISLLRATAIIDFKISNSDASFQTIENAVIDATFGVSSGYFYDGHIISSFSYSNFDIETISFYFVYYDKFTSTSNYIQYISSTDFNVIESVTYQQPTTIIGYINDFFETHLLGEIPLVRDITFNIGGQDVNLMTWLIMCLGFVFIGLIIFLFIKLLIWLFKICSNAILLR